MPKAKSDPKKSFAKDRYVDTPVSGKPAEELLEMAKIHLMCEFPFLGKLITRMPLVEDNRFPTTAVDPKGRFYYNRKWVNSFTFDDAVFEAGHEVGHMIQRCHARKPKGAIHFIWNKAADWIDDLALIQAGLKRSSISEEAISDEDLKIAEELGTIEAVYRYLLQKAEDDTDCEACKKLFKMAKKAGQEQNKQDQAEVDKMDKSKQGEQGGKEEGEEEGEGSGEGEGQGDHGELDGAGCGGDEPSPDEHTCGGVRMCCAGSSADAQEATAEEVQATLENVLEAYHKAKERGNSPGTIFENMIRDLVKSHVRWQDHLKTAARNVFGKGRYSWKKMGRRSDLAGLRFPNRDPEAKACAFVIDASGSVDEDEYIQALSEGAEIVRQSGCQKLLLVVHDFDVYYVGEVDESTIRNAPKRDGGTSHIDVFEVLDGKSEKWPVKEKPALVVCFTDLGTCFPDREPEYPVIWGVFEGWEHMPVPWGKKVRVPVTRTRNRRY